MSETPLHFKTITVLAALLKSKALSPVEVMEAKGLVRHPPEESLGLSLFGGCCWEYFS